MEKRKVILQIAIEVHIEPDNLPYGVTGGAEGEDAVNEAISHLVDSMYIQTVHCYQYQDISIVSEPEVITYNVEKIK